MVLSTVHKLEQIKQITELFKVKDPCSEQIFILSGVHWNEYESIIQDSSISKGIRFSYVEGSLEIMSPSRSHEAIKKRMAILLESYLTTTEIDFFPLGSTTFRNRETQKGIEPDESYCFETEKDTPDLAIEVVIISGGIDSLKIYQGLGVPEVWFWQNNQLRVYSLQENEYQQVTHSQLLPELDLALFTQCLLSSESPRKILREFTKHPPFTGG